MSTAEVVLIGVLFVFAMLLMITGILFLLPLIVGNIEKLSEKKKSKTENKNENIKDVPAVNGDNEPENETNDDELIAVITAAIESYNSAVGSQRSFRVVSLKRGNGNKREFQ